MSKTIQMKTTVTEGGVKSTVNGYPITTPDRVIDGNGVSVETHLSNKENKSLTATTLPAIAIKGTIYDLGEQSTVSIVLPGTGAIGDWVKVGFVSGATAPTVTITSTAGLSEWTAPVDTNKIFIIFAEWARLDSSNYGWLLSYKAFTKAV